ncbi:glycosyltransferase family 4 protein [Minwuia thermotolerans]|uniref:Glycosyl transferase n=1 Tax=Minwuia thermotolerans TaxID=2056226 RepID=A0A2M9FX41_9PROT|nr:glycosyltransferase family 4 protein [Minwuia thermotolerans]PJK28035.1 glycosyl transferase [Minwuia thermotolerans]
MTDPGLTVLQVLPALETGGVERGTVDMAEALVAAGHRALVVSTGGSMVRQLTRVGAEHVELPVRSKNPLAIWRNIERLARLIETENVDLVHARSRAPAWSAMYAARRTNRRFVTTVHGAYGVGNRFKRAYNSVMVRGDRVIAISEFIRDYVIERYPESKPARVVVIPRGVDLDLFHPGDVPAARLIQLSELWSLPDGAPVILLPGRLTRLKGQPVLIEALSLIANRDAVAVFVGGDLGRDAYKAELRQMAERFGVADRVWFVGACRDMPAAYSIASVVVSASTQPEGFGRIAVEAQAMGRPVIVTDHGGSRETVAPGETGWRVPPGDARAMATALDEALAMNQPERDALAARAVAHVKANYTKELMCRRTLDLYRDLLAQRD